MHKKILLYAFLLGTSVLSGPVHAYDISNITINTNDTSHSATSYDGFTTYDIVYLSFIPQQSGNYAIGTKTTSFDSFINLLSGNFDPQDQLSLNLNSINSNDDTPSIVNPSSDGGLNVALSPILSTMNCGSVNFLCSFLEYSLLAGETYYFTVNDLGLSGLFGGNENLEMYIAGSNIVQLNTTKYTTTVRPSENNNLATYLDANDGSGSLAVLASTLNTYNEYQITDALNIVFPTATLTSNETNSATAGQNISTIMDRAGSVLGNLSSTKNFLNDANNAPSIAQQNLASFYNQDGHNNYQGDGMATLAASPYKKLQIGDNAFWLEGMGSVAQHDRTALSLGADINTYGVMSGFEQALSENTLIGAMYGLYDTRIITDNSAGHTDTTTHNAGLYAQHIMDDLKFIGILSYGRASNDSERHINVGAVSTTANADYKSNFYALGGGVSKLFVDSKGNQYEPMLQTQLVHSTTDGYTERDAGALNMAVAASDMTYATAKISFTFKSDLIGKNGLKHSFKIQPSILRQFEINDGNTGVKFVTGTSTTTIRGNSLNQTLLGLASEYSIDMNDYSSIKFGIDALASDNMRQLTTFIGYNLKF